MELCRDCDDIVYEAIRRGRDTRVARAEPLPDNEDEGKGDDAVEGKRAARAENLPLN